MTRARVRLAGRAGRAGRPGRRERLPGARSGIGGRVLAAPTGSWYRFVAGACPAGGEPIARVVRHRLAQAPRSGSAEPAASPAPRRRTSVAPATRDVGRSVLLVGPPAPSTAGRARRRRARPAARRPCAAGGGRSRSSSGTPCLAPGKHPRPAGASCAERSTRTVQSGARTDRMALDRPPLARRFRRAQGEVTACRDAAVTEPITDSRAQRTVTQRCVHRSRRRPARTRWLRDPPGGPDRVHQWTDSPASVARMAHDQASNL